MFDCFHSKPDSFHGIYVSFYYDPPCRVCSCRLYRASPTKGLPSDMTPHLGQTSIQTSFLITAHSHRSISGKMAERKPHPNQLATDLPGPTAYLTGHNNEGKAIIHSKNPVEWKSYDEDKLSMREAFTTSFPADLNNDADVEDHKKKMESGKLGLVSGGGTVLRYVDFAPDYECMMHRTQSVDYGIVIEGQVESVLDSGEIQLMQRGDVMVQRATMHAWRNPSKTEWARMIFVL